MNGRFTHEKLILDPLERIGRRRGARTRRQVRVSLALRHGYVDLVIERGDMRIAVEAELTSRRVGRDIVKAEALAANELWIVAPNAGIARLIRVRLNELAIKRKNNSVFVFTQGQAQQRLTKCFPGI